jgi:hypothetical protein
MSASFKVIREIMQAEAAAKAEAAAGEGLRSWPKTPSVKASPPWLPACSSKY